MRRTATLAAKTSLLLCLTQPHVAHALEMTLQSVGIRAQIGEKSDVIGRVAPESFHETALVANFGLPWSHAFQSGWTLRNRLLTHAGVLSGQNQRALVAAAIPALALSRHEDGFMIDTGLGLAWLSRHRFDLQDFGGPLQFALMLGIEMPLSRYYTAGYRFIHYSDAGIYAPGTIGTDMHMIELLYRF